MPHIIVGTAGHIDHGKTALVQCLTGIDADRLKEEKERGITIDIGFANLDLDETTRLGFVDVPGHEKFIKNMLAGIGGIDVVMLVVAADESIMPQTREHMDICSLLHVPCGLTVITKVDTVDKEIADLVELEVREYLEHTFLDGSPVVRNVILRDTKTLHEAGILFFTDFRSNKIPALQKNPIVSLCFYDPENRIQLQIKADVSLHNRDHITKEYWDASPEHSRVCYYMKELPGHNIVAPFMLKPEEVTQAQAYSFFAVATCHSLEWDILLLDSSGNKRARCTFDENGAFSSAHWLAP